MSLEGTIDGLKERNQCGKHKTPEADNPDPKTCSPTRASENEEDFGNEPIDNAVLEELLIKVQALSDENTQLKDQMMRSFADIQNMRKRFAQEKIALTQFATEELIVELLSRS